MKASPTDCVMHHIIIVALDIDTHTYFTTAT